MKLGKGRLTAFYRRTAVRYVTILLMSLTCFLAMTQRLRSAELLIFSADWCGHCQTLKADVKTDPSIVEGYEWGYVDVEQEKELAREYSVKSLPTIIVIGTDNKEVKRQVGYKGPENLKKWLNDTKPFRNGVRHDSKNAHYVGGTVFGRRFRSGWDN